MAGSHDEKRGLVWSLVSWVAAILGGVVVGWIAATVLGEAAAGIIVGGVVFVVLLWFLSQRLGPPAADEAAHLPAGEAAAHAAPVVAPVAAPVPAPTVPAPTVPAPEAGGISERVREAARAAGAAARAAVGDVTPPALVGEPVRPAALARPREGGADDLKRIKGVGPKLEALLHGLGFWHFDQIAAWTGAEVAWVDEHLEGFNGRATRDDWVGQSKILAAGAETEFSQRVDRGEVY